MHANLPYGCLVAKTLESRRVGGLILSETAYAPYLSLPEHAHERACVIIVRQGSFIETYGSRTRSCAASSVLFRPPDELHADAFESAGGRCLNIEIETQWLERVREHSALPRDSMELGGGLIASLATRLCTEFNSPDGASALAIEGLALEILAESSRRAPRVRSSNLSRTPAERAREFIHAHFAEAISLAQTASAVGIHPVHLAREFRKHYRCTIGEYVRQLRVQAACQRLATSDEALGQLALELGFFDQSHFSRTFKTFIGQSPASYRQTYRFCKAGARA